MTGASDYCRDLISTTGAAWNRFWFMPRDPSMLCALRIPVGCAALYYVASFTPDLTLWFGAGGALSVDNVRELTNRYHWSYLNWIQDDMTLRVAHAVAMGLLLAFVLGWWTRVTAVLSLVVVLSYIHRAPMLAGQFEGVLSMFLLYLCLAPCGHRYSLDQWRAVRRGHLPTVDIQSVAATLSTRLMQVHLALIYATLGLSKLAAETWWTGEAVWWLIAHRESRLIDLTFLHAWPFAINAWSHAIVTFELAFAVLIWNRLPRPLLLIAAVVMWTSLAIITGLVSFCALMIAGCLCFIEPGCLTKRKPRLPE